MDAKTMEGPFNNANFMQQTGQAQSGLGALLGGGNLGQFIQPPLTIPLSAADWKKLSRDTQIKVLDELGILNAQ